MASAPTSTNRLLLVLRGFSDRAATLNSTKKRSRADAVDRFVSLAPTFLATTVPSASCDRPSLKRIKSEPNKSSTDTQAVDESHKEVKEASSPDPNPDSEAADKQTEVNEKVPGETAEHGVAKEKPLEEQRDIAEKSLMEDLPLADLKRCQATYQIQQEELEKMENTRQKILQEVVEVWGAYRYGLTQIAGLTDLSEAPDAIMPGNF